jgi:CRISPR-associated endonuclease/helicase Cas3
MVVTFISQCEKKALNRSRRVLDAFADRIGDNTWQTIITKDGLIAVKTLLRRTASKNTAVSCHRVRSRSRFDLIWVVGAKHKFGPRGAVPVNTTSKDLFMDVDTGKPIGGVFYANTQLQRLDQHLFAVGYVAEQLSKQLLPDREGNYSSVIFASGCLHDVGKIDPVFQNWVIKPSSQSLPSQDGQHIDKGRFSFDKHPRHNEVSLLLYHLLDRQDLKFINQANKRCIKHVIYWHHAKPFRKSANDFCDYQGLFTKLNKSLVKQSISDLSTQAINLLNDVVALDSEYRFESNSILSQCYGGPVSAEEIEALEDAPSLPAYKSYTGFDEVQDYSRQIKTNANNNIARACVISADRMVSALTSSMLDTHIQNRSLNELVTQALLQESSLTTHIDDCLAKFPQNQRSDQQSQRAKNLANTPGVAVLAGAAGCGKTKIALEWSKLTGVQQIIWVCPRVQICQGLFYDLISEQYLPDAQIEINTGEFKYTNQWDQPTPDGMDFSGDVVITTIDQIFSAIISHTKADLLIKLLNVHVVFDEYHEYINMPAFNLLFAELVACKGEQNNLANTLLVSATPHYFYVEKVLSIDRGDIVTMPSFNTRSYRLERHIYDESDVTNANPLYSPKGQNTIVISNTATTAQASFMANQTGENAILIHSKYKKSDKAKLFDEVFQSFKKDGTGKYTVLRSGPIVQAALNISCTSMVSEITSAENCLQRLGRLDRFGQSAKTNVYTIAIPESISQGKGSGSAARFLTRMFSLQSALAWDQLLFSELGDEEFTLDRIYQIYCQFHTLETTTLRIASDLCAALKDSVRLINCQVVDPITVPPKKSQQGRSKIKKSSLRGNNRFVQMAVCDVTNHSQTHFLDTYAYVVGTDESIEIDSLTASCSEIEGYGNSENNLLAHMKKKHHNIMGGTKAYNDAILLNEARDPERPVFLSYTPADLDQVGGESARHSAAIYYAECDKQPIGAVSIKKLINRGE